MLPFGLAASCLPKRRHAMMKLSLLAGAAALLALAVPETAVAQAGYGYAPQNSACERQRGDDKLAGGVAGALIGGLIGGAIGNNIDGNDDHYRGRRGYRGHGYDRGYRRSYHRGHSRSSDNSDQVVVGALLGALVGGIAGSEIASSSSANCGSAGPTPYQPANSYPGAYNQGGSIPRTTDGLYGGPEVMQPRYPASPPPPRAYPASSGYNDGYSDQGYDTQPYYGEQAYSQEECRTIYQYGEHVLACRNSPTETWRVVGDRAQDQELYGY
tara:strand:- start:2541 stop:3350 length:810 start_codon:yes stop_codon:yes gene_type:complete